jgi:hypothetical protein
MTEEERDVVRDRLNALGAEAERAWQELTCPRPARFWTVALQRGQWTAAERQHLQSCPHCRAAEGKVHMAVQVHVAPVAAALVLVAARLLRRLPAVSRLADLAATPPPVRLSFPDDPDLEALLLLDQGEHWLQFEHRNVPAATLVLVTVAHAAAPAWSRFLVLRPGVDHAVARCRVEAALRDERDCQLAVRIISSPAALQAADATLLQQSFDVARRDDVAALPAWESWARAARQQVGEQTPLARIFEEIVTQASRGA